MKRLLPFLFIICFGVAKGQIPNAGMENWAGFIYEDPENWTTFNFFSFIAGAPYTVTKTTDSHSGSFAAQLEAHQFTDTSGQVIELPGLMYSADANGNGFPVNQRYATFTFWYKYNNVGGDTALVIASLQKWNNTTQTSDSVGFAAFFITSSATSWQQINAPFQYFTNETPDTAFIAVFSSINEVFLAGSILKVDDFSFSGIANINELQAASIKVYPNPAAHFITIEAENSIRGTVELFDLTGRKVLTGSMNAATTSIRVDELKPANYLYILKDKDGQVLKTGKIQVDR